jgi:hypothetical protein
VSVFCELLIFFSAKSHSVVFCSFSLSFALCVFMWMCVWVMQVGCAALMQLGILAPLVVTDGAEIAVSIVCILAALVIAGRTVWQLRRHASA